MPVSSSKPDTPFKHLLDKSTQLATILVMTSALGACGGGGGNNSGGDDPFGGGGNNGGDSSGDGSGGGGGVVIPNPESNLSLNLSAVPDTAMHGEALNFRVTAEDASGTVSYELLTAPGGMSIDANSGEISWTPNERRFNHRQNTAFTVKVSDNLGSIARSGNIDVLSDAPPIMTRSSAKVPTKDNMIRVADIDDDGRIEILTTNNQTLLFSLEYDPISKSYQQDWVYPYHLGQGQDIDAFDIADLNSDGLPDIAVLTGSIVSIINGADKSLLSQLDLKHLQGHALALKDIDNNGSIDISVLTTLAIENEITIGAETSVETQYLQQLSVLELSDNNTLTTQWSRQGDFGEAMLVEQLDSDAPLEITLQNGVIYDGVSHDNQWMGSATADFGDTIVAADLNADGIKEIVGLIAPEKGAFVNIYNAQDNSDHIGHQNTAGFDMCSLTAANIDEDAEDEVLIGYCSEIDNGLRTIPTVDRPIIEFLVAFSTKGSEGSTAALQTEWEFDHLAAFEYDDEGNATNAEDITVLLTHGGFRSLTVANLDDNPDDLEIVWANYFTGSEERLFDQFTTFDINEHLLAVSTEGIHTQGIQQQTFELGYCEGFYKGALYSQTNSDEYNIVFSSYREDFDYLTSVHTYEEYFHTLNPDSAHIQRLDKLIGSSELHRPMKSMTTADFEGLSYDQVVFSQTSSTEVLGSSSREEWSMLMVADISDPAAVSSLNIRSTTAPDYEGAVTAGLISNDDKPDVITFMAGLISSFRFEPSLESLWTSVQLFNETVDIKLSNLDEDGEQELLTLSPTELQIRNRKAGSLDEGDGYYGNIFLNQKNIGGNEFTALEVGDISSDGISEIIVADQINDNDSKISIYNAAAGHLLSWTLTGQRVDDLMLNTLNGQTLLLIAHTETKVIDRAIPEQGNDKDDSISRSVISSYAFSSDNSAVRVLHRSPQLLGRVMDNGMNLSPDNRLIIGTESAIYLID